jgi:hypothetical protein
MSDRIDHRHDHEAETDRHSDVPERLRLGVDHDRATTREDERKRAANSATRRRAEIPIE